MIANKILKCLHLSLSCKARIAFPHWSSSRRVSPQKQYAYDKQHTLKTIYVHVGIQQSFSMINGLPPPREGYSQKNWMAVFGRLLKTTIYDQKLWFFLPYFWHDQKIDTPFINILAGTVRHYLRGAFCSPYTVREHPHQPLDNTCSCSIWDNMPNLYLHHNL